MSWKKKRSRSHLKNLDFRPFTRLRPIAASHIYQQYSSTLYPSRQPTSNSSSRNFVSFNMSSSSQPLGKCVVCGEDSHLRCGECAKHGTQLFFCGSAHQKSVSFWLPSRSHNATSWPDAQGNNFPPPRQVELTSVN